MFGDLKYFLLLITISFLTACGALQDNGAGEGTPMISRVVDGYIALSVVYHDMNEDGIKDAYEPSAISDKDGFVSYNPVTDTNYCADSAAREYMHCLLVNPAEEGNVLIRMEGGYDTVNSVPFVGAMALRKDITQVSPAAPATGSPVTTLLAGMSASDVTKFLSNEGLTSLNGSEDYMAFTTSVSQISSEGELKLAKVALRAHKVVDVIASALSLRFAGVSGVPADLSSTVYSELVKFVVSASLNPTNDPLETILADTTRLNTLATIVYGVLDVKYDESAATPVFSSIADQAKEINSTVTNAFGAKTTVSKGEMFAGMRSVEVATALARDFANVTLADVQAATAMAANTDYMTKLADDATGDVNSLVARMDATFDPATDFVIRQNLDSLTSGGQGLDGQTLTLNDGADGVTMDFVASAGSQTDGTVEISLPLAAGESTAATVDATWQKMDDYSMLIVVDGVDSFMLKPIVQPDGSYTYLFDLDNQVVEWSPPAGQTGFTTTTP